LHNMSTAGKKYDQDRLVWANGDSKFTNHNYLSAPPGMMAMMGPFEARNGAALDNWEAGRVCSCPSLSNLGVPSSRLPAWRRNVSENVAF